MAGLQGRRGIALLLSLLACLPGCMLRQLHRDLEEIHEYGVLRGTVAAAPPVAGDIVVIAYAGAAGREQVIDTFTLAAPGAYFFMLPSGTYRLAAFADRDRDAVYQAGSDPAGLYAAAVVVTGGGTLEGLDIAIEASSAARIEFPVVVPAGGHRGAKRLPEINVGVVTDLDAQRFAAPNPRMGLWQPVEFLFDVGAGVYFLEPYQKDKIPVLFVHGAVGSPANFRALVARLDRARFQPWLAYYPTAMPLDLIGAGIDRWMQRLYVTHEFSELIVVAHSMGGLVARSFINHMVARPDGDLAATLRLFVTLSSPWAGDARAALGMEQSPAVAPSWYDMAPGSAFLKSLLQQPPPVPHHLLFSYGGGSRVREEANDGVVTLASQLEPRAQRGATRLYGFDRSHMGILEDPEVATLLHGILAAAAE